jgi:hypothetical protein
MNGIHLALVITINTGQRTDEKEMETNVLM